MNVLTHLPISTLVAPSMTPDQIVASALARRLHMVDGRLQDLDPGAQVRCETLSRVAADAFVVESAVRDGTIGGQGAGVVSSTAIWGPLVLAARAA